MFVFFFMDFLLYFDIPIFGFHIVLVVKLWVGYIWESLVVALEGMYLMPYIVTKTIVGLPLLRLLGVVKKNLPWLKHHCWWALCQTWPLNWYNFKFISVQGSSSSFLLLVTETILNLISKWTSPTLIQEDIFLINFQRMNKACWNRTWLSSRCTFLSGSFTSMSSFDSFVRILSTLYDIIQFSHSFFFFIIIWVFLFFF